MNVKRTIAILALLLMPIVIVTGAIGTDAEQAFSSEVSYFDGFVIVQGTVPEAYSNDQSHVEIEIQKTNGDFLAPGYAKPTSDGVYRGLVKVPLSKGQYLIKIDLVGSGQKTIRTSENLIIDDSTVVAVKSISLSPSSKELVVGGTATLICTIDPITATDQYITWSSSNSSIASVDDNGKVTANSVGTATITATSIGGKEATSTIAVKPPSGGSSESDTLDIVASNYTLYPDGTYVTLTAIYPSSIGPDSLRWSVSPSNYASFVESNTTGKATVHLEGKAVGTVTVTLSSVASNVTATARLSIIEKPDSDYSFFLRMDLDYDKANYGTSGLTAEDLKEGVVFTGSGVNAGVALESALRANGVPCSFWSGGELKYWVNDIFGVGDYQYSNGDWKYWIQYHNGSYNDWTLGHYTDGGSFELIYGITDKSGQVIKPPGYEDNPDNPPSPKPDDPVNPPGPEPIEPSIPDAPNDHLDPTDPTVTVEKDSIQNADGTITNVQTLTKTEEDGKTTTTVITTTPQNDGTVEEIKSTSNSQTNEGGIKTESSLETVTIKDPNGSVKSETHIEVSVIDTTGSSGTGTKGVTITANDKGGNATVKAEHQEGSQSASVVTEVKTSEENGQIVISHESLDVALKMQEMYSKKIVNENESVKDATKVIQVGSGSSDANVKLSSDIVKKIADADSAILVSGMAGSMEVSKGVMSNISEYDDIVISVAKAIADVLTDEQKAAINSDATVVKVKVMSGDKSIGDKLNGEITISIKHVTAPGMVPVAYYVHDDGTMEKVDGKYNMKNNEMVVKTTHCSIYAVIDEAPESSSDGNILLYAGIAIAAVIIIAAIAIFMLRRR